VKGCSCKQAEYNPTEIEAANKKAQAEPAEAAAQANAAGGTQVPAPVADPGETPELDLEITGSTQPAAAEPTEEPAPQAAPPSPPPAAAQAPEPAPSDQGQSTIIKKPRAAVN